MLPYSIHLELVTPYAIISSRKIDGGNGLENKN